MNRSKEVSFRTAFSTYRVKGQRGSGGTGVVYEVEDVEGKSYALKVVDPRADTKKLRRFKNEIWFCLKQTHKNIIEVFDYGVSTSDEGQASFYVMPLYAATLRTLMSNGIGAGDILPLFSQILDGVEAAHLQSVHHRDLKPENILYEPRTNALVVADFGIAKFKEEDLYTAVETNDRERLANFLYSAPEQRMRGKGVDSRADIYALGLILNEMFTREVPQGTGFKPIAVVSSDHAYLDKIVDGMIQQDPERRPDSIRAVKELLIGRRNEFVSLQRLNSLKTEVVPEQSIDDPIIMNPIRLLSVDYVGHKLHLKLSQAPNSRWILRFQKLGSFSAIWEKEPSKFRFEVDLAYIPADERDAQMLVNHFKKYLESTNREYAAEVEANQRKETERRRRELQQGIAEEEKRQRILNTLQF
jgi:serine/threonine protein kinase